MSVIVVERAFDEPGDFDELQRHEQQSSWCLETHRVKPLYSYFSTDRRRMLCFYEAPDAEAVRRAQAEAGMPVSGVWVVGEHQPPIR